MDRKFRISIIMGVLNPERNPLFESVCSILRQDFPDWEFILYNDGSGPAATRMIQEAAGMDSRITYLEGKQTCGLAHALNECIRHTCSPYIARMDADDLSLPHRLGEQYCFLEQNPQYQWVGSCAQLIDSGGGWGIQKVPEKPEKEDFLFNSPFIHPTVVFRREALVLTGGYDPSPKSRYAEDYELFMRLYRNGLRGYNLQQPLLQYREDYRAHLRRTYRRRIQEMQLRRYGFQQLGILNFRAVPYVLKPLFVGLIPADIHHSINRRIKRQGEDTA